MYCNIYWAIKALCRYAINSEYINMECINNAHNMQECNAASFLSSSLHELKMNEINEFKHFLNEIQYNLPEIWNPVEWSNVKRPRPVPPERMLLHNTKRRIIVLPMYAIRSSLRQQGRYIRVLLKTTTLFTLVCRYAIVRRSKAIHFAGYSFENS